MTGQRAIFIVALSAAFGLSLSQSITPMPYNQSESVSSCTHGLISEIDTAVFKYLVDLTDDPNATDVYFHTKNKYDTKYNFVCHMTLTTQCNNEHEEGMCTCRTVTEYVMEIKVKIKVQMSHNGALLRGNIVGSKSSHQIRSKESSFPEIYESTNTQGHLTINKKELKDEEKCSEIVRVSELMITYSCLSPAVPCVIEISTDESTQKVIGNGTVNYYATFNKSQAITATIKRAACTLLGKLGTTKCFISMDIELNVEKEKASPANEMTQVVFYIIIITITSSIVTIGALILVFIIFRNKIFESTFLNSRKQISKTVTRKKKEKLEDEEQLIPHEDLMDGRMDIFKSRGEDYTNCSRNPLHEGCIFFRDFTLLKLPEHMQDKDIFQLINTMADLTVMVTFFDGFDESKMGTGWVGYVVQYTEKDNCTCSCKECKAKTSPSSVWGELTVYTSTDVVPSNSGGMQVTCSFMFDDDERKALHLTGCEVEAKFSKCRIKFKTCNMTLLRTLDLKRQKINDLNYKINNKYRNLRDGSMISNDEERLAIIVSYIHGLNKCVSLGSWTHRYAKINKKNNIEITKYTYTNPTCLGSTGAYVYILGRGHCGWLYQHYHVGVNALGQGFCGYGIDAM